MYCACKSTYMSLDAIFIYASVYSSALHGESEANTSRDDKRIVVMSAQSKHYRELLVDWFASFLCVVSRKISH